MVLVSRAADHDGEHTPATGPAARSLPESSTTARAATVDAGAVARKRRVVASALQDLHGI